MMTPMQWIRDRSRGIMTRSLIFYAAEVHVRSRHGRDREKNFHDVIEEEPAALFCEMLRAES